VTAAPASSPRRRRRPWAAPLGVWLLFAGIALAGLALGLGIGGGDRGQARVGPAPPRVPLSALTMTPQQALPDPRATAGPGTDHRPRRPARPVRVIVPAVGIRASIVRLGLNQDHTLQAPTDFSKAGWWSGGPRPGEVGPAVVVGHVDSKSGPAAFYAIRSMRRGDAIKIVGADGRVTTFVAQRVNSFPKAHFPTKQVYGSTRAPRLRLITCSGTFDQATGHYLDNTIVFARLARR
jgi:hypothetical protein